MDSDYGRRIRERRLALKMSQAELSRVCGLSPITVCQFENSDGSRKPSLLSLVKLSDGLKCSVDYLLGKKAYDITDLLADARMVEMLEGIQHFSDERIDQLVKVYEFLKDRESRHRLGSSEGIHPSERVPVSDRRVA